MKVGLSKLYRENPLYRLVHFSCPYHPAYWIHAGIVHTISAENPVQAEHKIKHHRMLLTAAVLNIKKLDCKSYAYCSLF
jgi:hypothetical protein